MLKALMPVAVYSIGVLLKKESFSSKTMTNMVGISVGVGIAAYGEALFNTLGVMLQLGAVVFEATRGGEGLDSYCYFMLFNAKQSEKRVLDGEKEANSLLEESPHAQSEGNHDTGFGDRNV
ncbi:hypothetical protein SUGI_0044240 [Cryptomeria japonica]|nr:hypothetical protein SUGI_0044240 [Cryptomeria japonica]